MEGKERDAMLNEVAMLDQAGMKALTVAIGVLGPRLAAAAMKPRGRRAEDLSIARWFETYKITAKFPEMPGISDEASELLSEVLEGDETQAALQELLAVRLTDGSNAEAGQAREVFRLTLATADPSLSQFGPVLADFYDSQISEMVARLEASEPSMLTQIRSEALSGRMIATLRAIERHTAALSSRPNPRSEASFLASYRSHVIDQHGKLEPPDFDRRRRVPIADIYVPATIYEEIPPERTVASVQQEPPSLSVWELAGRLDRTVLLGDPGGGKTPASNVLMHYFASDETRRVPFLVTLRNYAASDAPGRSVVGYIEHELETLYQCPAPSGLVDMLLLSGRAAVIFDGLDELLDTTRRADVATRVEHFCAEYPLAPILVTSRMVGYDQARLDETQFITYRLGGFRNNDVADYADKWFALEEGAHIDEAQTFLVESESAPDLRTNPLLLSLMCILYRGEGSLPRNRAEVYEQCANLLFRRWDARRRIHQELRAGHLIEPTLRHLAWWLFTREDTQTAVTERELVMATTDFLHGRGFEAEDDARDAAREFIEFCRGRMWVFSDAGTTPTGEKLYSFTHRTFLEYFAAAQLAFDSDTPEKLARELTPRIARGEWEVVGEVAIQIKDTTSREGARRIYKSILDERRHRSTNSRSNILQFLARTLRSVDPSPQFVRRLAREILDFMFSGDPAMGERYMPLSLLMGGSNSFHIIVNEEISTTIAALISSSEPIQHANGLRLAIWLENGSVLASSRRAQATQRNSTLRGFWAEQGVQYRKKYKRELHRAAERCPGIRNGALAVEAITIREALGMDGDLVSLVRHQRKGVFGPVWVSTLRSEFISLIYDGENRKSVKAMASVGSYLIRNPQPPWGHGKADDPSWTYHGQAPIRSASFGPATYLGSAAVACILAESDIDAVYSDLSVNPAGLGPFHALFPYIQRRGRLNIGTPLPDLPVPKEFKRVFRDWAEGKVNFTAPAPDSPDQNTA